MRASQTKERQSRRASATSDDYLDLVRRFPLRPIRTYKEYEAAASTMDELLLRADGLSPDQSDYVQVLAHMIHAYDQRHASAADSKTTPIEALKFLMQENQMNTVDLGELVGGSGQASMILRGKRELSKANIRALADRFRVSPALFF